MRTRRAGWRGQSDGFGVITWFRCPKSRTLRYRRAALNQYLQGACEETNGRRMQGRAETVEAQWVQERAALRALPPFATSGVPFCTAEVTSCRVDSQARIRVRTNHYSS